MVFSLARCYPVVARVYVVSNAVFFVLLAAIVVLVATQVLCRSVPSLLFLFVSELTRVHMLIL